MDTQAPFIQVRMETGYVFWAVAKPGMSIRSRIFVAWDFTHNCPVEIMLKQGGNLDRITEADIFSVSVVSGLSRDGVIDTTLVDTFSITANDEDDSDVPSSASQRSS